MRRVGSPNASVIADTVAVNAALVAIAESTDDFYYRA